MTQVELLKLSKRGQFPDEPVRIKDSQVHNVNSLPDVLGIPRIKEITLEGRLL
jgi:hypothetical protein